jgi:hypothetical protein
MTRRPTRSEVLVAFLYLAAVAALTWLALLSPFTYAYLVRFVILLPSSFVALLLDYWVAVLLFGPDPSTWVAGVYYMAVAIAAGALQLTLAWTIRNRAR